MVGTSLRGTALRESRNDPKRQAPLDLLEPGRWLPQLQELLEGHKGFFFDHRDPQPSGKPLLMLYKSKREAWMGKPLSKAFLNDLHKMLEMLEEPLRGGYVDIFHRVYQPHFETCSSFVDRVLQGWAQLRPDGAQPPPAKLMSVVVDLAKRKIAEEEYDTWVRDQAGLTGKGHKPGTSVALQAMDWEFLPSGWWGDQDSQHRKNIMSGLPPKEAKMVQERLDFLVAQRPEAWWRGLKLGGRQYHVAEFPHLAVAECALEGNAIYYLHKNCGDWRFVFTRSKSQALALGAFRIIHDPEGSWRSTLRRVIRR
jgi:hypothetical protein